MKFHTSSEYNIIIGDRPRIGRYTNNVNQSARKRRTWIGQEIGSIPASDLYLKMEFQNWECIYCGEKITFEICELDHVYPMVKGGGHYLYNVAFACFDCNQSKKDKTLSRFCKKRGYDLDEIRQRMTDINQKLHYLIFPNDE